MAQLASKISTQVEIASWARVWQKWLHQIKDLKNVGLDGGQHFATLLYGPRSTNVAPSP